MYRTLSALTCAAILSLPTPALAMPVSEFLPKAEKLVNSGMGAMFSKHRKPVMAEMKKVTKGYRSDIEKARAAGRSPSSCPPPKGKGNLNAKEFLAHLKSIPTAQRNMEVQSAFHGYMKKKYPC
ncbi:MAG: hypothetical protein ABJO01_11980 [Parasphingorhabdus sp.]|uniref:hypothetical protein n=1 Tax=Parasphingorhabdus sp. TaxID=2709688 RepID=UPI003298441E